MLEVKGDPTGDPLPSRGAFGGNQPLSGLEMRHSKPTIAPFLPGTNRISFQPDRNSNPNPRKKLSRFNMSPPIDEADKQHNMARTENGAAALKSTLSATVDFFGLGGALRSRESSEVTSLFSKAFEEDPLVALKTLFYLRDIRGGQGERKTFRACYQWLAREHPETALKNLQNVIEFGRWDDLFCTQGTQLWEGAVLPLIYKEWGYGGSPSLMWKWLPSNNTSSRETRALADKVRSFLGVTPRAYRKRLSAKRAELKIVERDMCGRRWNQIDYSAVPSRASLIYRNAFEKHDPSRYQSFLEDVKEGRTTINTGTLYPYDIVEKCFAGDESETLDVLWNSLPNYSVEDTGNGIVVADVSGSMSGRPMAVSVSLAMYISERNQGAFKNQFITFSEQPSLQQVTGNTVMEKVQNLEAADWGGSTNLEAVFTLILEKANRLNLQSEELPERVYIVSDMEFNQACQSPEATLFQTMDAAYKAAGYKRPELVFWNVNARNTHCPVRFDEAGTCLVSGCSPSILTSLLSGGTASPVQVMLETINTNRYNCVEV